MEMYEDFALVYDRFMDETPYEEWCQFVVGRLKQDQITDGILLDLGCGTGSMTELLAKQGYDMIGVDLSDSMLDIAMEKRAQSGHNILYLQQDMREFELYGTVRAVICLCDSLNYLLKEDDPSAARLYDGNDETARGTVRADFCRGAGCRYARQCNGNE